MARNHVLSDPLRLTQRQSRRGGSAPPTSDLLGILCRQATQYVVTSHQKVILTGLRVQATAVVLAMDLADGMPSREAMPKFTR